MTPDFSRKTRRIIGDSAYGPELQALAIWMAAERYRPFEVEQHLRRMDYMLGRLPSSSTFATHDADVLAAAFGVGGTGKTRESSGGGGGGGGGGLGGGGASRQHSQDALWTEDELR